MPKPKDLSSAVEQIEQPTIKWQPVAMIAGAFVVLWITAFMIQSYSPGVWGWVAIGVVGALSVTALGFGIYIWRLTTRSRNIVSILQQATDEEGRKRALEQLEQEGKKGDAMNALARAQLVARESPQKAIEVLEEIDLAKAPAVVQDDVRANLGYLYLMSNRAKDARKLADELRLDRQSSAKAKAMYAAVAAEAFARTGKPDEARKLLETYKADDPEYGEVRAMLLRAQAYTYVTTKNAGLAQDALKKLAEIDPNHLAPFLAKSVRPELQKMAQKALKSVGLMPKQKMQFQRR